MQADDPPFLPVGTDVSAKYKGAFCEAKIKKVVRNIKCKVTFKGAGAGSSTVSDDAIKGTLRVGNTVEVKVDQKKELLEAIIAKIQDCSQYTVVFDDGDITTLRRSALCLKSGRHFAESETLDQLPLTHPEHFGNPVIGSSGRRGRRTNRTQSDDSDSEASEWAGASTGTGAGPGNTITEREPHAGRVVLVQCSTGDKKRAQSHQWFPGLVVAPNAQDTVKIKVKDDYLVRSFKDGRYYTVPKKEAREFRRNNSSVDYSGLDAAILYLDEGTLPAHWDRDILFGQESQSLSDEIDSDDSMDDEPHEEKDHFVAQLYKFMDDRGTPLNRQPTIANRDIDLYRLFNVVQKLGGYNRVTNQNQWKKIALRLGFHPATTSVTNLCRQAYKKFLHSFEDFYRKLGVTLLSKVRTGRTTGRSLIRDRDKMHSTTPKSSSPAPTTTNNLTTTTTTATTTVIVATTVSCSVEEKVPKSPEQNVKPVTKGKDKDKDKDKDSEKDSKSKDKEKEKEIKTKESENVKEKETKTATKEKDTKDKDVKDKENKSVEKEKQESKKETKAKDKESKENINKEKTKEKENSKVKQKEIKIKELVSSEEDSGDNQPLAPLSIKTEKLEPNSSNEKQPEKAKPVETTPKSSKLFKSASGTIDGKRGDKGSTKKITHRRNSLPRCTPSGIKGDHSAKEARCKSSSSDSSTTNKKQSSDTDKAKEKEPSGPSKKHVSSASDKNDSDSSSKGSKNGKTPSRRNNTSNEIPPSTPSSNFQFQPSKKPRKRKMTEAGETPSAKINTADVGDKLKVYYFGPTHSESSSITYEAKVIEINGKGLDTMLRVHYTGWNTRYDEWIKPARIADNLTQQAKKLKEKGKRNSSKDSSDSSSPTKKARTSQSSSTSSTPKHSTRNRSGSNNINASNQLTTDASVHSESGSDTESDSSSQKRKKITEDSKSIQVKVEKLSPEDLIPPSIPTEKVSEPIKEKVKVPKVSKTPSVKRTAESSQNRVKRTRVKPDENTSPRVVGRDFDLNEIRSEMKGLDAPKLSKLDASKSPAKELIKIEPGTQAIDDIKIAFKTEKTPEKVADDIYEFKEPEPFEFEARKSEEKKKRLTTHRLFDDIPPLKLSPNNSPDKPPPAPEPEKPAQKTHYEVVFDKLCHSDNQYQSVEETNQSGGEKEGEAMSLFSELANEDSADRLLISEGEDSQEPLFTYQQPELFPEKPYTPIFKGFQPAKNQETYSKKDAINKTRGVEDDFNNSPVKGEQSSDEDPIDAAIQRVNAHSMSDDSNDGDLLIKTPSTPTVPAGGLLATFVSDSSDSNKDNITKITESMEIIPIPRIEPENEMKIENEPIKPEEVIETIKEEPIVEEEKETSIMTLAEVASERSEADSIASFADVIVMPEPPAGFLIHKEGPSIAEKVLRAINCAKKATSPILKETIKSNKSEPISIPLPYIPKPIVVNVNAQALHNHLNEIKKINDIEVAILSLPKTEEPKPEIKPEVLNKEVSQAKSVEAPSKQESIPIKFVISKKEVIERRKSVPEPALGGKSNKVLSETIQKLSSQICQLTPALPLPDYQADDRSDTTDSDDSDRRLIIDKLSEEESQSCISLSENSLSQPLRTHNEKMNTTPWSTTESQHDTDNEKSISVPEITIVKEPMMRQPEEDSNISSLLLCEETIPGSPAPENLGEPIKNLTKARTRHIELPFSSPSSLSQEQITKESCHKENMSRDRDIIRDRRDNPMVKNDVSINNNPNSENINDNSSPTTPESSDENNSPDRVQQSNELTHQADSKSNEEESRVLVPSKKVNELDKSSSGGNIRNSAPNSPGAGPCRRGRRPRGCRLSETEDQSNTTMSHSLHRQSKYNFYVDLDPFLDGAARISLIMSRLSELRTVYHNLKAELATIDRRRKKLRRKEREAIKAAKAACS